MNNYFAVYVHNIDVITLMKQLVLNIDFLPRARLVLFSFRNSL